MRAIVRVEGVASDVSGATFTGSLIYQDGTRIAIVPIFDTDAVGDGTDGALRYSGVLQEDVPVGLHNYQFHATEGTTRLSTSKIHFRVFPNA
jgi:hypothetical protein